MPQECPCCQGLMESPEAVGFTLPDGTFEPMIYLCADCKIPDPEPECGFVSTMAIIRQAYHAMTGLSAVEP